MLAGTGFAVVYLNSPIFLYDQKTSRRTMETIAICRLENVAEKNMPFQISADVPVFTKDVAEDGKLLSGFYHNRLPHIKSSPCRKQRGPFTCTGKLQNCFVKSLRPAANTFIHINHNKNR